ncbi:DUF2798 domain-containing protein [Marinobacter zhejiangensis]|nr:DUF2798 domain-containing protein [Marinobacter zhejiangensis]
MSGLMSLLMSGVITFINTGFASGYLLRWMHAFVVAWAVAFPLVSLIAPLARRLTDLVLGNPVPSDVQPVSTEPPQ